MAISALKDLRKLTTGLEGDEAFKNLPRRLKREKSDRAAITMCACILDAGLKAGIGKQLPNEEAALKLFDDRGPLRDLAAKIRMAEALDLFGPITRRNLDIIQTVRNAFAHSLLVDSFATPEVATACDALVMPPEAEMNLLLWNNTLPFSTHREKVVFIVIATGFFVLVSGTPFEDDNGVRAIYPRLS